MLRKLVMSYVLYVLPMSANASQIVRLDIEQQADVFEIQVEMEVAASVEDIRAVLMDFNNLGRLNASITSSEIIHSEKNGAVRVLTRMENCVLFFCVDMQKVEDVTEDERGRILVAIVPEQSSFRSGQATWEIRSAGNGSHVIHHAKLEPDIHVPALVGSAILKKSLREEIVESFRNLDCLSRSQCTPATGRTYMDDHEDLLYEM